MQRVNFDWILIRNQQNCERHSLGWWKKLNIDLIFDNTMELLLILLCVIMVWQWSKIMFYSQERYAEVSRSDISRCLQMCLKDNDPWAESGGYLCVHFSNFYTVYVCMKQFCNKTWRKKEWPPLFLCLVGISLCVGVTDLLMQEQNQVGRVELDKSSSLLWRGVWMLWMHPLFPGFKIP